MGAVLLGEEPPKHWGRGHPRRAARAHGWRQATAAMVVVVSLVVSAGARGKAPPPVALCCDLAPPKSVCHVTAFVVRINVSYAATHMCHKFEGIVLRRFLDQFLEDVC